MRAVDSTKVQSQNRSVPCPGQDKGSLQIDQNVRNERRPMLGLVMRLSTPRHPKSNESLSSTQIFPGVP